VSSCVTVRLPVRAWWQFSEVRSRKTAVRPGLPNGCVSLAAAPRQKLGSQLFLPPRFCRTTRITGSALPEIVPAVLSS